MTDVTPGSDDSDFVLDGEESAPGVAAEARAFSGGGEDHVLVNGIETAQAIAEESRRWAAEKRDKARDFIRESPLTAAGLCVAGGILFGMLLNRR